jgi:hypothetical protein
MPVAPTVPLHLCFIKYNSYTDGITPHYTCTQYSSSNIFERKVVKRSSQYLRPHLRGREDSDAVEREEDAAHEHVPQRVLLTHVVACVTNQSETMRSVARYSFEKIYRCSTKSNTQCNATP